MGPLRRIQNPDGTWGSWTSIKTTTGTAFNDVDVTSGTVYQYRVRPYGDGGWGSYSNIVKVTAN